MKVLFSLRHSFAIRNFDPVLRELARRGHEVELSLLSGGKSGSDAYAQELSETVPGITVTAAPGRKSGRWFAFSRWLRFLVDASRYRLPMYDRAPKLRARAMRRLTRGQLRLLRLPLFRWSWCNSLLRRSLLTLEMAVPVGEPVMREVRDCRPDLIIVSPLVDFGSDQVDYVKIGSDLGIPTALAVNSWDNLTNKGLVRVQPDQVYVWNRIQLQEAVDYHRAARASLVVTGAPTYDRWFDRAPSDTPEAFKLRVGLDQAAPFVLYMCSSPFIAEREAEFVGRWLEAVRASEDERLRHVGILVRPHPENRQPWGRLSTESLGNVAIWPRAGANPIDAPGQADYYDSMFHSSAVVGLNSSGLIEAGIVGRPVLTILEPAFADTQLGTLHFQYLLDVGGGLLEVARSWGEHRKQLTEAIRLPERTSTRSSSFVGEFVRPLGLDVSATSTMVDSLVALAERSNRRPQPRRTGHRVLRFALEPFATRRISKSRAGSGGPRPAEHTKASRRGRGTARGESAAAADQLVQSLVSSDAELVLIGPWTGGVGMELLYWIPFVRWIVQRSGLPRDRLAVVTRGGAACWYRDLTARCVEILEYMTVQEFLDKNPVRSADSAPYQRVVSDLDRELVRIAKQATGARKVKVLHPAEMCRLFEPYWKDGSREELVEACTSSRLIESPTGGRAPDTSSDSYLSAHFYFNEFLPDTRSNRAVVQSLMEQISATGDVLLVSADRLQLDARDFKTGIAGNVRELSGEMSPHSNLVVQTAAIQQSRGFVGTCGGFMALPPLCGVDSVAVLSDPAGKQSPHWRRLLRILETVPGSGRLRLLSTTDDAEDLKNITRALAGDGS